MHAHAGLAGYRLIKPRAMLFAPFAKYTCQEEQKIASFSFFFSVSSSSYSGSWNIQNASL